MHERRIGNWLHQTPWAWVPETLAKLMGETFKWTSIVNKDPSWQGKLCHQQVLSRSPAVPEMSVSTGGKAKRKHWHVKWPRRQMWRKQPGSSWCFSFQPQASCSSPRPRWTWTHSKKTEAFLSKGSQTFSLFQQWSHLAASGVIFFARGPRRGGASDSERRHAYFAALAATWWDGAESFSGVTYFLPLRLAFNRVSLLLTFRISSPSHHLLRYLHNSLFISTHSANFFFSLRGVNSKLLIGTFVLVQLSLVILLFLFYFYFFK